MDTLFYVVFGGGLLLVFCVLAVLGSARGMPGSRGASMKRRRAARVPGGEPAGRSATEPPRDQPATRAA